MTATLYRTAKPDGKPSPLWRNGWTGWPNWVIPARPLAEIVHEYGPLIDTALETMNGEKAWKGYLAAEISSVTKVSYEAAVRRLFGVLSGEQTIINATFAEAALMALGLDLDRDTNIPTLPGNMRLAQELIRVRSDSKNDLEIRRHAKTAIRLSALILNYPHNQERLQDLAPYDCLRPY